MSQNDLSIANQGFASFRSDLNSALQALGSTNSGTSAPSTTYANQLFYDTTNNILKIRNEDNDAFISLFTLDQANDNIESLTINGALSCEGFTSNGIDDNADATAITITSAELVGIGTSPSTRLHVYQATGNTALRVESAEANAQASINFKNDARRYDVGINSSDSFFISDDTASSTRLTINSSGNVGIGTTSPDVLLDLETSSSSVLDINSTNANGGFIKFIRSGTTKGYIGSSQAIVGGGDEDDLGIRAQADFTIATGGSNERMRIASDGQISIGNNNPSDDTPAIGFTFNQSGTTTSFMNIGHTSSAGTSDGYVRFVRSNTVIGQIRTDGVTNVQYATSSDYRLKENIVTEWDATTRLKQLKPSRFNFKEEKDKTRDGFIAHEVSSIVPEAVGGEKDAVDKNGNIDPQTIDHSKLVPLMVKTIQELEARIATLESK